MGLSNERKIFIIFLTLIYFFILIRTAWVGDDSYITMRTIDNFINGYGLTWNTGERVQSFTHPLWALLLIPIYIMSNNAYTALLVLSFLTSLLTMFLLLTSKTWDMLSLVIGWTILVLSNSFIDYSTSGLENPLSHLIIMIFLLLYLNSKEEMSNRQILILALLVSLVTLNRIDLLLIFIPALCEILMRQGCKRTIGIFFLGFIPLIIWELFSIIYYGFPFPNTFYAKLNTGISHAVLFKYGILYFFNSIAWDPLTLIITGTSFIGSMLIGRKKEKVISVGILLYLFYVLWIGGDFMSGRFFSATLLVSVFIFLSLINNSSGIHKIIYLIVIGLIGFSAYTLSFNAPITRNDEMENLTGVSDEQAWYYPSTGLLKWGRENTLPYHPWVYEGRELQEQKIKVFVGKGIGFLGFNAGPNVHVIDYFALSDPLLSRLSVNPHARILIGHFRRAIPKGYIETLETGTNQIENENIAQYYDVLSLITRGDIWSLERWQAIWKINTGQYEYLLQ